VTQYSSHRREEPRLSRTIFRLVVVFVIAFALFKVYPLAKSRWGGWFAEEPAASVVERVESEVASGDLEGAASLLDESIAVENDPARRKELLLQRVDLAEKAQDWSVAVQRLEELLRDYPGDSERPRYVARYGNTLEKQERFEEARKQYEGLLKSAPLGMRAPAYIGLGRIALHEEKLVAARDSYRQALDDAAIDSEAWNVALDALGDLNVTLAFSQMETPESKYYTIESGDNLTAIGIKLNTTQGLLMRANGMTDPGTLHLGQRLKYTPKDFRIVIERSTCRLFLMDNQGPFKRYYTGLGMPGHETTLGTYTIGSKQKDPTWFPKNRPSVPPGDPENELGTRWLPMVPAEESLPGDLGIHGTIVPASIGFYQSHGCPRMHNAEVEELYDLVVRSTPVNVVETIDWSQYSTS